MNQNTSPHPFKGPDSTELFNFLLNNIPDLIYFKDLESRFICVNDALIKLLGLKEAGEVIGISDFDYMAPEEARRTFMDEQQVIRTGEPIRGHITRKVHPDGSLLWVLTTKLPLRNAKGEIIGTCGISKDVTSLKETEDALARSNGELERALAELKAAQRQLIHAEKSQLTARLAAGIAHEVRNPLNILNTGLEFISSEKSVADNPTISMVLQEMRDAIRRADNVISTLMDASRPEGLELEATDMNAMIGSLVAEMSGKLESAGVHASLQLAPDLPFIHTDKKKIRQVINGLVSNAVEAMPNGGELQISTRVHRLTPDDITRDAGARGGQIFRAGNSVVTIEILDTGPGIPEEALTRVFDPFFTTKDPGVKTGLGLGLTVCRAMVELHGGTLGIANRHNCRGAKVTMKFKGLAAGGTDQPGIGVELQKV